MRATRPPLDYLLTSSQMSLESVELARLNRAANLRKELCDVVEEWIDAEVDARLARSILEWRRSEPSGAVGRRVDTSPGEPTQLAISFLPSLPEPTAATELAADPGLSAAHQAVDCPPPSVAARSRTGPYGFATVKVRLRHGKGSGESVRESTDCASRAVGPLAPRRVSLSKSADVALRLAEHRAYGHGKVLRGSGVGKTEGVNAECLQPLVSLAIRLIRRATMPGRDLRPAVPARTLLRCAADLDGQAAKAS